MNKTEISKQAFDFLRDYNEGVLATVSDGRPCLRAFQVMKIDGDTLFFATAPQKEVYRQLQANPAIEFMVLHYDSNTDTVEGGFAGERFGMYKA